MEVTLFNEISGLLFSDIIGMHPAFVSLLNYWKRDFYYAARCRKCKRFIFDSPAAAG